MDQIWTPVPNSEFDRLPLKDGDLVIVAVSEGGKRGLALTQYEDGFFYQPGTAFYVVGVTHILSEEKLLSLIAQ